MSCNKSETSFRNVFILYFREIMENGPVMALALLNDDLLVYGGGVYEVI